MRKLYIMKNEHDRLFVNEAAEILRVSTQTVHRMIQTDKLPAVKVGGRYQIRRVDIDGLLEPAAD